MKRPYQFPQSPPHCTTRAPLSVLARVFFVPGAPFLSRAEIAASPYFSGSLHLRSSHAFSLSLAPRAQTNVTRLPFLVFLFVLHRVWLLHVSSSIFYRIFASVPCSLPIHLSAPSWHFVCPPSSPLSPSLSRSFLLSTVLSHICRHNTPAACSRLRLAVSHGGRL